MTKTTREERVAMKLVDLLNDIRIDLHLVGMYIAKFARKSEWLRFEEIYQSANEEQKADLDRSKHYMEMESLGRHQ